MFIMFESLIMGGEKFSLVDRENNIANNLMGLNSPYQFFSRPFCYNCDFKMPFISPLLKKRIGTWAKKLKGYSSTGRKINE